MDPLKIGVVGCGRAARIHVGRLLAGGRTRIVGCADPDLEAARGLAALATAEGEGPPPAVVDHRELLADRPAPDALAIFAPHRARYRPAMDALQAGCHLFIEKPLSTNAQEAVDIVNLAKGRGRTVAVGHQYRLAPALIEARKRLADGAIGRLRLVSATLAAPWLAAHRGPENSWRYDPKQAGGGILADSGDHLIDALLWTTGRPAAEVAAFQDRLESGLDVVTAAALRLADGTCAALSISGVAAAELFELTYFGESGQIRATPSRLDQSDGDGPPRSIDLPAATTDVDADFVAALADGRAPCCPGDAALETVRLLESMARAAALGQVVRLS